jgi:hypothetical protein
LVHRPRFRPALQFLHREAALNADTDHPDADRRGDRQSQSFWSSPAGWVAIGFIGVASYFLITEHAAHLASILPWLLIAACPLMHLFMHHGGHGRHDHRSGGSATRPEDKP